VQEARGLSLRGKVCELVERRFHVLPSVIRRQSSDGAIESRRNISRQLVARRGQRPSLGTTPPPSAGGALGVAFTTPNDEEITISRGLAQRNAGWSALTFRASCWNAWACVFVSQHGARNRQVWGCGSGGRPLQVSCLRMFFEPPLREYPGESEAASLGQCVAKVMRAVCDARGCHHQQRAPIYM